MSGIDGMDQITALVDDFEWDDFRDVRRLVWESNDSGECYVELILERRDCTPPMVVTARFDRPQGLRVSDWGCMSMRIIGLYVKDISDRQWEGIRWQIGDYEHNVIAFYCENIHIVSAALL